MPDEMARTAPAAERNKEPILAVLRQVLPKTGLVLEIASGTGQHAMHFAAALSGLTWQPSDPDAESRILIEAWIAKAGLQNVLPPLALNVHARPWPLERADAVVCINMVDISPWQATLDVVSGAARLLGPEGVLFLYGPYRRFGAHTAPSNEVFDASLRAAIPNGAFARTRGFASAPSETRPERGAFAGARNNQRRARSPRPARQPTTSRLARLALARG